MGFDIRKISFDSIRSEIDEYIKSLPNYEDIKDTFAASNIEVIKDLMAGFGSYISYNQFVNRRETYLSEARLESSVYNIAKAFGYRINRYSAPVLKVRYVGLSPVTIGMGDKVGSYGSYDLFYFGDDVRLNQHDTLDVVVGKYRRYGSGHGSWVSSDGVVDSGRYRVSSDVGGGNGSFNFGDELYFDLVPIAGGLRSVGRVRMSVNSSDRVLSESIEDYVVDSSPLDLSLDPYSARIYVLDKTYSYGLWSLASGVTSLTVSFDCVETDGELGDDFNSGSINFEDVADVDGNSGGFSGGSFIYVSLESGGSNGDSLEKIRRVAPLFYSTLRRMVTLRDHKYIAESHSLIHSAVASRPVGVPTEVHLGLNSSLFTGGNLDAAATFTVTLSNTSLDFPSDVNYSYDAAADLSSVSSILNELHTVMKNSVYVSVSLVGTPGNYTALRVLNRDSRINVVVEVNGTHFTRGASAFTGGVDISNVKPVPCAVNINYVKSTLRTVGGESENFTNYELVELSRYFNRYKMVGVRLIFLPASLRSVSINLNVEYNGDSYTVDVNGKIRDILLHSSFVVGGGFDFGRFLVEVSDLRVVDSSDSSVDIAGVLGVDVGLSPVNSGGVYTNTSVGGSDSHYLGFSLVINNIEVSMS